jgi:glucose/arabinose dehydrogenase
MKNLFKNIISTLLFLPLILMAQSPNVGVIETAVGFNSLVSVTNAGDDSNRLFVTQQSGEIKIVEEDGNHIATPFLDISTLTIGGGERGLLGLAFHPQYEINGYFYVNYTNLNGDTVVDRFTVSGDPNIANIASRQQVLTFDQPFGNHNAGDLHFSPMDGFLYISTGDGGDAAEAQNLDSLLGNVLRIDINGDDFPQDTNKNYAIPADNPYVGQSGANEIWVSGLRNPWRFSFDRQNGDLYIGDVGEDLFEEFNYQSASSLGGENFGWPCYEGTSVFSTNGCGDISEYTFPFNALEHNQPSTNYCTAVGGYVYRGQTFNYLRGWYFYTDWCDGEFFITRQLINGTWETHSLGTLVGGFAVTGFGESESGELYIVASTDLLQIVGNEDIFVSGFESN